MGKKRFLWLKGIDSTKWFNETYLIITVEQFRVFVEFFTETLF